jgi:crotonobetainyl-CoA:carnitine CoA-transferase CaiB-like acyl-CoA transferase
LANALADLRILELSRAAAAPMCCRLLAGFGAEVLKIEQPGTGDPARNSGPYQGDRPDREKSAPFLYLNSGKKSITLDPETATGREILLRLLKDADVIVEDLGPAKMRHLHLDFAELQATNPRLIMASISFYGQTGPYSSYEAGELTGFAMSGYMSITGQPDREPLKPAGNLGQYEGGLHAATAVMAALLQRDLTGQGQLVDTSIAEATCYAASMMGPWLNTGDLFRRDGNRHPTRNPHHHYPTTSLPCKDGWVHLHYPSSGNDLIAMLLDIPQLLESGLAEEPRGHADEIDKLCLPWLAEHDKFEIVQRAQELRLPFTEVLSPQEILEDPQHAARGYFVEVDHPATGVVRQAGAPFQASDTPWQTAPAPLLGEHNREIYCDRLGYSLDELGRMRALGIL